MDGRNKKWYTDGTVDIKLFDTDDIPEGFYRGRAKSPISGKSVYNNGVDKKYFKDTDVIPDGWVKGDLPKTEEHQLKINSKLKGRIFSDIHKAKISEANYKRFSDKTNHPMYGKHHSENTTI